MAKGLALLIAVTAAGAGAYIYRDDLPPLAEHYLPPPAAAAIKLAVGSISPAKATTTTSAPAATGKGGARQPQGNQQPASKGKRGGGPAPVTAATAVLADMPIILAAPGTVEPMATVGIKPRVDGQIVEVMFKEGDMVEAGSVLFRLDDRMVRALIRQAEASITKDKASLKDAAANLDRKESLLLKRYASEATTDTARQQVEVLRASIAAGEAMLEMQKTQLDYLTIKAPITGRTGSINAKLGSFVRSADQVHLVTINQTRPISVSFALPQANLPALKAALAGGAEAVITVPGIKPLKVRGRLDFVDNQVDKSTGTVTAKVQVANEDEALWPGQAVNVALTVEVRKDVVSVPASAVLPAQQGMIAWVIGDDNRVKYRVVRQDRVLDQTAYIISGLQPGDRVVTDGQLRLAQGAQVIIRDSNRPSGPAGAKGGKGNGSGKKDGKPHEAASDDHKPTSAGNSARSNGRS